MPSETKFIKRQTGNAHLQLAALPSRGGNRNHDSEGFQEAGMVDPSNICVCLSEITASKCKWYCLGPSVLLWYGKTMLSFHRFPNCKETSRRGSDVVNQREGWMRVLRTGKTVTRAMTVRSWHFSASDAFLQENKSVWICGEIYIYIPLDSVIWFGNFVRRHTQ